MTEVFCPGCEAAVVVPELGEADRGDLARRRVARTADAIARIRQLSGLDAVAAKRLVLHMCRKRGVCHKCGGALAERVGSCAACGSANVDWLGHGGKEES
jgi:hypothetical protein